MNQRLDKNVLLSTLPPFHVLWLSAGLGLSASPIWSTYSHLLPTQTNSHSSYATIHLPPHFHGPVVNSGVQIHYYSVSQCSKTTIVGYWINNIKTQKYLINLNWIERVLLSWSWYIPQANLLVMGTTQEIPFLKGAPRQTIPFFIVTPQP